MTTISLSSPLQSGRKELSRTQMYLQRDVAFGAVSSWSLLLEKVSLQGEDIILNLKVAPDQILAGGFKKPLTIVDYQRDSISMRIYGVTRNTIIRLLNLTTI